MQHFDDDLAMQHFDDDLAMQHFDDDLSVVGHIPLKAPDPIRTLKLTKGKVS